jgi:glycyl-tRNA synthetase beta chain
MMQQSAVVLNSGSVKALLRDHRTREDVLEAVLSLHESGHPGHAMGEAAAAGDLANVFRWADALGRLVASGDGLVLLACYRHADQLLRDAEEKDAERYDGKPQPALYRHKEERELAIAVSIARREALAALGAQDFDQAMRAVATLRPYVKAFFAKVSFESAITDLRENRLRLVNELIATLRSVGDLSKIEQQAEVA